MQNDLISRQAVEKAIKEFNKKRVNKVPNTLGMEEHSKMMDTLLEENVEMLRIIQGIPTAYDMEKVVQQLKQNIDNCSEEDLDNCKNTTCQKCRFERINRIVRNGGKE